MTSERSRVSSDAKVRCAWGTGAADYAAYHDAEWGRPVVDDFRLFEKICLEGFQSGLSWLTILRKRENFRAAFAGFDFRIVANYDEARVQELLADSGIIRHRGKIEATINNAGRACELVDEFGSLARYFWMWEPQTQEPDLADPTRTLQPNATATSKALSRDLKRRGWKFFGPTTAYAFMQAMGLVNDHAEDCFCRAEVDALRRNFARPR